MHKNASYLWTTPECSRQITDRCWFRSPLLLLKPSLEVWLANSKSWDFFQQLDKASMRTLAAETRGRRDFGWRAKPFFELLFFWLSAPARRLGWTLGLLGCFCSSSCCYQKPLWKILRLATNREKLRKDLCSKVAIGRKKSCWSCKPLPLFLSSPLSLGPVGFSRWGTTWILQGGL